VVTGLIIGPSWAAVIMEMQSAKRLVWMVTRLSERLGRSEAGMLPSTSAAPTGSTFLFATLRVGDLDEGTVTAFFDSTLVTEPRRLRVGAAGGGGTDGGTDAEPTSAIRARDAATILTLTAGAARLTANDRRQVRNIEGSVCWSGEDRRRIALRIECLEMMNTGRLSLVARR
jgi:hypothetical protein